jgi:hypothetical protein
LVFPVSFSCKKSILGTAEVMEMECMKNALALAKPLTKPLSSYAVLVAGAAIAK